MAEHGADAPGAEHGAGTPDSIDEPLVFQDVSSDPHLKAPLALLGGAAPEAPAWFVHAIGTAHERQQVLVDGAAVEWLAWGERGRPGLMLLHGNGANADWWRFIAPFLAETHRVVAPSWSGMGGSDHRATYSVRQFVGEALAVADAAGLAAPFAVAGHSFGGAPAVALAAWHPDRIAQAIVIDSPLGDERRPRNRPEPQPHRIYPTLAEALARFRWAPMQPSGNLYITDFIARSSLKQVADGWTWKFDPYLWSHFAAERMADLVSAVGVPLTYMWGEQSALVQLGVVDVLRQRLPAGTRFVGLPQAHHHVMADQPLALVAALRSLLA